MSVWRNSVVEEIYCDDQPSHEFHAEVRIDGPEIVVNYTNEEGPVDYRGKEEAPGHFRLKSVNRNGEASLHRFPESHLLDGFWREDQYRGFWRVQLRK